MRLAALFLLTSSWTAVTQSCFPLNPTLDQRLNDLQPVTPVTVSIIKPANSRTVGQGSLVEVEWTAANTTGDDAIATVLVRKRDDRAETILSGGIRLGSSGVHEVMDWNTAGFERGRYNVIVRIEAGTETKEEISNAVVTLNAAPSLTFNEPFEDVTLEEDTDTEDDEVPNIPIRWTASDADGDGTFSIELDLDTDHTNENEIVIREGDLPESGTLESFEFEGKDVDGTQIDGGTYFYFARLTDEENGESFVEGLARITLPPKPEESDAVLAVTKPEEDTSFLTTADPLDITFTLNESKDVLVDLKIDTDDNHTNGNELTILAQKLVAKTVHEDTFAWNGNNSVGNPVPDGLYRVFVVVNRGSGTPGTAQADGLVFRRNDANKPLIGLTAPAADQTVRAGNFININWRDDDPSNSAKVFLFLDDDPNPAEAVETDAAEREVLANRDAQPDAVSDTFAWQVFNDLAPGTYYLFAYIDRDGAAPFEHSNVAAGRLIIQDPNSNN